MSDRISTQAPVLDGQNLEPTLAPSYFIDSDNAAV